LERLENKDRFSTQKITIIETDLVKRDSTVIKK